MTERFYFFYFLLVQVVVQSLQHAVESYFGRVGNKRENSVCNVVVHS